MNDLMLDVECMGMGADGALVSIGAVFFDEHQGQLGAEFHRAINLATAVQRGGTLDPSTIMWWLGQDDAARNSVRFNGEHIDYALKEFHDFVLKHRTDRMVRVWGCSPTFDCEKVRSALGRSEVDVPWLYFNERCYRTIRERNRSVAQAEREGLHNALEDAKYQANHLIAIRNASHARRATV